MDNSLEIGLRAHINSWAEAKGIDLSELKISVSVHVKAIGRSKKGSTSTVSTGRGTRSNPLKRQERVSDQKMAEVWGQVMNCSWGERLKGRRLKEVLTIIHEDHRAGKADLIDEATVERLSDMRLFPHPGMVAQKLNQVLIKHGVLFRFATEKGENWSKGPYNLYRYG